MRIKLYAERRVLLHALGRQSGGWNNVQYWHVWYLCGWKMWGMLMGNKFAMVCLHFGSVSQRRTTPEAIEPKLIPVWVTRRIAALLEKWCKSIEGFKCNHQNFAGKIRCHPIILDHCGIQVCRSITLHSDIPTHGPRMDRLFPLYECVEISSSCTNM